MNDILQDLAKTTESRVQDVKEFISLSDHLEQVRISVTRRTFLKAMHKNKLSSTENFIRFFNFINYFHIFRTN